jgi:hypothetical protein
MYTIDETRDATCFKKAQQRGQRTWTVVEQDLTAVRTIAHWIYLNIETAPDDKLRTALEEILVMRKFPKRKNAD